MRMIYDRTIQNHSKSRYVCTYVHRWAERGRRWGCLTCSRIISFSRNEVPFFATNMAVNFTVSLQQWDHSWRCSKRQMMWLEGSTLVYKELHTWQTLVKFNLSLTFHLINRLTPILYRVAFPHLPPHPYSPPPSLLSSSSSLPPPPPPHSSIPEMEGGSVRYSHSGGGSRGTSGSTTRPGGATPATGGALLEACCCCCCCYWRQ